MSNKNGLPDQFRLAATLATETNPTSPILMGGNPVERIKEASLLGFDAVELHWPDPALIPLGEIQEACKRFEMEICAFATGRAYTMEGLNLIDHEEQTRQIAIKRLMSFVDAAAPHGATVILGCIRGNLDPGASREAALERLAESTRIAATYGQEKGVGFVFEAINRYENNYLNTAQETIQFILDYDIPNTKVLLDTFHMNIEDADPARSILECGDLLGYVHLADSNRQFAGAGHIPLEKIIASLQDIDYHGVVSAECLPLPDPESALKGWMDGMKHMFS